MAATSVRVALADDDRRLQIGGGTLMQTTTRDLGSRIPTTICLLLALSARAQGGEQSLPLLDAVERALAHYPSVAASLAGRDAAGAAVGEAEAARFPSVAIGGAATRYQEPTVVHPIHAFTPERTPPFDRTLFQVLGQVSYMVYDGGARSSRIDASRAELGAAEELVAGAEQTLLGLVVGAYLEALGQAQAIEAHDRSIAALESELQRVRQSFDVGRAAQIEILRVEAAIASAEAERVRRASALDGAERDLARWVGAPVDETRAERLVAVSLVDSPLPQRDDLQQRALASSPSVRAARQRLLAAESGILGARSALLPGLSLDASYVDYASAGGVDQLEWNVGCVSPIPSSLAAPSRARSRVPTPTGAAPPRRRASPKRR